MHTHTDIDIMLLTRTPSRAAWQNLSKQDRSRSGTQKGNLFIEVIIKLNSKSIRWVREMIRKVSELVRILRCESIYFLD